MAAPTRVSAALAALVLLGAPVAARAGGAVAVDQARLRAGATLQVIVPGVAPDGALPVGYTADGRNTSPPLTWTAGPGGTKSYAVLVQDPDAPGARPAVHWFVWNVPADVKGLPKAMRNIASPTTPLGAAQGRNYHGSVGYSGPRPPPGDPAHHYHFQVFALNRTLRVAPGSDPEPVLAAMAGHVVASGERVATFAAPAPRIPKGPSAAPGVAAPTVAPDAR